MEPWLLFCLIIWSAFLCPIIFFSYLDYETFNRDVVVRLLHDMRETERSLLGDKLVAIDSVTGKARRLIYRHPMLSAISRANKIIDHPGLYFIMSIGDPTVYERCREIEREMSGLRKSNDPPDLLLCWVDACLRYGQVLKFDYDLFAYLGGYPIERVYHIDLAKDGLYSLVPSRIRRELIRCLPGLERLVEIDCQIVHYLDFLKKNLAKGDKER